MALGILNGDHAQFEAEWAGADPKERPDWPYPSFDARDWTEAFMRHNPSCDEELVYVWFCNALMRGYDEERPELAELRAENARLRARLAVGQDSYGTRPPHPRLGEWDDAFQCYARVRDQLFRNCQTSVGMAEPLNNDHEQDGA